MHHGFDITFREVVPELGLVQLVARELDKLQRSDGLRCSVVLSRLGAERAAFAARVELRGRDDLPTALFGQAAAEDPDRALRQAFGILRAACDAQPVAGTSALRRLRSAR